MEWKKAKNYIIAFLVAVNCLLLVLNAYKWSTSRLSSDDIEAVTSVLANKGITLSCTLPDDFSDMGQLYMREYEYDNIELQEIFFGGINGVRRTQSGNDIIFTLDSGVLTVSDAGIEFSCIADTAPQDTSQARTLVLNYVDELNYSFADFREQTSTQTDEGWQFEFGQTFHSRHIFSNCLIADVSRDGEVSIAFNYQEPLEYKGSKQSVISAAEAVFAVSRYLSEGDSIDTVKIGYYLSERHGSGELVAAPRYKIYVNVNEKIYYVNAYSGDVFDK